MQKTFTQVCIFLLLMLVSQCSECASILGSDLQINKFILFLGMLKEKEVVNFNTSPIDSP